MDDVTYRLLLLEVDGRDRRGELTTHMVNLPLPYTGTSTSARRLQGPCGGSSVRASRGIPFGRRQPASPVGRPLLGADDPSFSE